LDHHSLSGGISIATAEISILARLYCANVRTRHKMACNSIHFGSAGLRRRAADPTSENIINSSRIMSVAFTILEYAYGMWRPKL
jgi:hypothetical protein